MTNWLTWRYCTHVNGTLPQNVILVTHCMLQLELELQVKGLKEKLELAKLETCALQLKTEYFL